MIHLDTNFLIGAAGRGTAAESIQEWLMAGETLAISAIAWTEFLSGPVTSQQIQQATYLVEGRIVSFDIGEAVKAAELFNYIGRKRVTRFDCLIAATAFCADAVLATENKKDFLPFLGAGLRLA